MKKYDSKNGTKRFLMYSAFGKGCKKGIEDTTKQDFFCFK